MKIKKIITLIIFSLFLSTLFSKEYTEVELTNLRNSVVEEVKKYIGCPYKHGAIGPNAFDCSGLIYTVFKNAARINLPRSAKSIYSYVTIVPFSEIELGDLIFFKTTGNGTISHVAIYIGRNQFIHAASDGSTTGVIVSSLNEKYYKNTYAAVGKPFPKAKDSSITTQKKQESSSNKTTTETTIKNTESQKKTSQSKSQSSSSQSQPTSSPSTSSFLNNFELDTTLSCDWSFLMPQGFVFNHRGVSFTNVLKYTQWKIQPGIGATLRWNEGTKCFQIPFFFSLNTSEYFGMYIGPVITFGSARIPNGKAEIKTSFFPGIVGMSFNTPKIKIGTLNFSLTTDLFYTFYTTVNNSSLSFQNAISSGLVLSTGIRVTFPLQ